MIVIILRAGNNKFNLSVKEIGDRLYKVVVDDVSVYDIVVLKSMY